MIRTGVGNYINTTAYHALLQNIFKDGFNAKPDQKLIFKMTYAAIPKDSRKKWVQLTEKFNNYKDNKIGSGDEIITVPESYYYYIATTCACCNAYYIKDTANLLLTQTETINTMLNFAALRTKTTADRRNAILEFIDHMCAGNSASEYLHTLLVG